MGTRRLGNHFPRDERTLLGTMAAAPLRGTASRVWALSPTFGDYDDDKKAEWLRQSTYTGRLSYLRDLNINIPSLKHEAEDVIRLANKESSQGVPRSALILLGHRPRMRAADEPKIGYYLPVQGSDHRVFIKTNKINEDKMQASGTVTGILRSKDSQSLAGIGTVLDGVNLPSRIGIVALESAAQVNAEHPNTTLIGVVGGLLMLGFGTLLIRRAAG